MTSKGRQLKILIADDHPIVREGLVRIVESDESFEVVGETGNGESALQLILQKSPDIAVLDLSMPGLGGLEVIRKSNDRNDPVEFIVLTMFKEEAFFDQALDLGVKGYLLKESAVTDLVACLHAVADGKYYVSPLVSDLLVSRAERTGRGTERDSDAEHLTETERHIIRLLAENLTSREIGERLHISYRTVQKHRTNICAKLGLQGYNSLYRYAIQHKASL